ncbi:hypothetical protein WHR41_07696 [Cladosporium halotolerans]|uniref:Transcription initiation factor IIF subunit beta n=1 Tax=Cladosporium halotolerans TaxID=1052096 RepID=A0AB34KJN3_9PEZI
MADMAIKPEIKADPADSKEGLADVDEFEEDTDLYIPHDPPQGWLARVPPELWQAWSEMYNDAPAGDDKIKIGSLRVYENTEGSVDQKLELHLEKSVQPTRDLPKTYNLKLQTSAYNNSVVFSEKDLPGHKSQAFGRNRYNPGKSAGINKNDRYNKEPAKKIGGYSSVIPKQTALAAKILHEANLVPVEDNEYYKSLERTLTKAMQPKVNTTFQLGLVKGGQPGQQNNTFSSFTTTSRPKGKKKAVKEKAVRMSQTEMFDALHRCFREFKYWSLKALRHRLNQPEAYIKSSLEQIGHLIRSGDFAMQYVLNPDYAASLNIKDGDVAAEAAESGESDSGEEADDDDMELEDVKMES